VVKLFISLLIVCIHCNWVIIDKTYTILNLPYMIYLLLLYPNKMQNKIWYRTEGNEKINSI